jgi:hypothetical protein
MDLGAVLLLVATFGTGAATGLFLAFSVAVTLLMAASFAACLVASVDLSAA